jgi:hypothetical protein
MSPGLAELWGVDIFISFLLFGTEERLHGSLKIMQNAPEFVPV